VNQPVVLLVQLNVREYGRRYNGLGTVCATERSPSMYIRMRVLPSNTLLAWGRLGSISAPLNQPVVLLVQLNVGNMEEGKIATAWAQFMTERSPSMYIRMCYLE
jgi:hypothetical protein